MAGRLIIVRRDTSGNCTVGVVRVHSTRIRATPSAETRWAFDLHIDKIKQAGVECSPIGTQWTNGARMNCNNCQKENDEGAAVCVGCGRRLKLPADSVKRRASIRLYPEQRKQISDQHGSPQAAIDALFPPYPRRWIWRKKINEEQSL